MEQTKTAEQAKNRILQPKLIHLSYIEENKNYNKTQSHSALYYSKKHSNEITQWYWWNKSVGARFKGWVFSPCFLRKLD